MVYNVLRIVMLIVPTDSFIAVLKGSAPPL